MLRRGLFVDHLVWSPTVGLIYDDSDSYRLWRLSRDGMRSPVAKNFGISAQGISTDAMGAEVAWSSVTCSGCGGPIYVKRILGTRVKTVAAHRGFRDVDPTLSPNGSRVAYERDAFHPFSIETTPAGIWISPVAGGRARRISADGDWPVWSPSGRWIVYDKGYTNLVVVAPNGKRRSTLRGAGGTVKLGSDYAWAPDSGKIAVWLHGLSIFNPATGRQHKLSFPTPARIAGFSWSPDSKTLLVAADGSCPTLWSISATGTAHHAVLRSC